MGELNILPLGEPDSRDVESAAKLYLQYEREGLLDDDVASSFAMCVEDYPAVYARATELKREQRTASKRAPGAPS